VFADDHGNCVHLYERDCSLQRRHQKVVEEAPAADLPSQVRDQMAQVAVHAARTIDYRGAGTVEFLYDAHGGHRGGDHSASNGFYFMEMNTRLQVEHPVTEAITGVDLVQWQLLVAAGEALPLSQEQIHISGHAIEARIYAEDPLRDFLPATGPVHWMHFPQSPGVRIDAGITAGTSVSAYYDPMIAKLIVHGDSREQAIARLRAALHASDLGPLANNIGFLRDLAAHDQWLRGAVDTRFLAQASEQLRGQVLPIAEAALAANAWLVTAPPSAPLNPWNQLRGMRLNLTACERSRLRVAGTLTDCLVEHHDEHCTIRLIVHDAAQPVDGAGTNTDPNPDLGPTAINAPPSTTESGDNQAHILHALRREKESVSFEYAGQQRRFRVHANGDDLYIDNGNARALVTVLASATPAQRSQFQGAGQMLSPMPGRVVSVLVAEGDRVAAKQALTVLEAMKMEHTLIAPGAGTITAVNCSAGEQVEEGVVLIAIELD
jgi:3-methylcrotonyl-CoA carboxylase alpha subunit